ncbi:DoxX family protein [Chitinibacteraceae bacterium HSL-7]
MKLPTVCTLARPLHRALDWLRPLADLALRLYLARVFFLSGWNKLTDWDTTLWLFSDEYRVPLLPPEAAAVAGTAAELVLPVLLLLGLGTRLSALGLFVLNAVAVVSYYHALSTSAAALGDHLQWALMLAAVMTLPAGRITLDAWYCRRHAAAA